MQQLDDDLLRIPLAAAALLVYWALIARWTSRRRWVALSDWARDNRFQLRRAEHVRLPDALADRSLQPVIALSDADTRLLQADSPAGADANARRWNVLCRAIPSPWPATALRPVAAQQSLVDLFALESYPVLGAGERFLVCGADKPSARVLARSHVRGLLPRDVGLLLHGRELLLDFSLRPFDEIEFGRMIALADQLAGNLPPL